MLVVKIKCICFGQPDSRKCSSLNISNVTVQRCENSKAKTIKSYVELMCAVSVRTKFLIG